MKGVRAFAIEDIPQVARLHQAVFRPEGRTSESALESYREYLSDVFIANPFSDPALPSLVYEDDRGRIAGFLGVAPRRLVANGRRYQAAVSSQFIVEPAGQPGLVAVRLAKAFLSGPQDVSICDEATETSRRIWEGLGGAAAHFLSLHWTRPLRPAQLALSFLGGRGRAAAWLGAAARPVAAVADVVATRWPRSQFYQPAIDDGGAGLDAGSLPELVSGLNQIDELHVEHDHDTLTWLLRRARQARRRGQLFHAVLRDGRRIRGWYVGHLDHGVAEVIDLGAEPASVAAVLDHLFQQAWRLGAVSASGRIDPRWLQVLSDRHCLFHRRGPWMLAHAKQPELANAFEAGHVSFSRLNGEWALAF